MSLKVIDSTPTAISKYLREKELDKNVSKEIPYSKKKCIDMAYDTGFNKAIEEFERIINKIFYIKDYCIVSVDKISELKKEINKLKEKQ